MTILTSDAIVFSLFPSPLSTPGGADKSYGIHVAQLAGIPRQVIHRAEEILEALERKGEARARRRAMKELTLPPALQLTLFGSETDPLVEELKTLPIILTSSCCRSRKPGTRLSAYPRSGLH